MVRRVLITIAASAGADLEAIRRGAEDQDARTVREVIKDILSEIERLALHPDRGRIVPELGVSVIREIVHPRFRIVYRRDATKVRIVRVWHGE